MLSRLLVTRQLIVQKKHQVWGNAVSKRFSGHNAMNIEPTNWQWKHFKDSLHFWFLIAAVPVSVLSTIINIRANPELTEIPEGYEPRHWEYFKHPISRWWAKYCSTPMELDHELMMAHFERESEKKIIRNIQKNIKKCKRFFNDHRSTNFRPWFADNVRMGRDLSNYTVRSATTSEGLYYDFAYSENTVVPVEGYQPEEMSEE